MRSYLPRVGAVTVGAWLGALASCSSESSTSTTSAAPPTAASSDDAARAALASAPIGYATSRDLRGAARFVAGAIDPDSLPVDVSGESAARLHLSRHAGMLGLDEAAVRDAVLDGAHALAGGAALFQFKQQLNGLDVFRGRASVVLDRARHMVSIANSFHPAALIAHSGKLLPFGLAPEDALANAYTAYSGAKLGAGAVRDEGPRGEGQSYRVTTPKGAPRVLQATAKRIFCPDDDALMPAYYIELLARADGSTANEAHGYVVNANDGRTLYEASLTASDVFNYRVWALPTGNHAPTDGPLADYTPHPTGRPDQMLPGPAAPIMVAMEGFNKNPKGAVDPWLAPTATFTFGNNVQAYSDRNGSTDDQGNEHNDGYDDGVDLRAEVTSPKTFDRVYDLASAPNVTPDQIKAAVTQIFYVTNWLHDYWYDSGFNEASGNAQLSNYGRGGVEGDPLHAEAQDSAASGQANNANMSTLSDGTSPRMQMYVWNGAPRRDGTIDNTVVAHEWGHYLHHRLVLCGSPSCDGMSEGWADFDALMLVVRDADTFDGKTYALSQYATSALIPNAGYFGIRRAPYSTDMTKNPFTFRHVRKASSLPGAMLSPAAPDLSEPHNVGEIWAETLFEAYVNLLAAGKAQNRPFEETKRRMADYVVAGMKAAPVEPTFVEQRDAVLSAVLASGRMDDFAAIARGFAKRGLGVGAVAPPTTSTTLNEMVENSDYKGNLALVDAKIDDSVRSCDRDGNLDAGETGKVTVRVRNSGWLPLTKTQVRVSTTDPNVTFDNDGLANVASLSPYAVATITIGVSVKDNAGKHGLLPIVINLSDVDAWKANLSTTFQAPYNLDFMPNASATDDVEGEPPAWTAAHGLRAQRTSGWSRLGDASNHVWHGDDVPALADESLVSPNLVVSPTSRFVIAFKHRYSFEVGPVVPGGADVPFDGGVLEISDDGGTTWKDVSTYVDPAYPRTLHVATGLPNPNPLAGRKAWAGQSTGYPDYVNASLDLGTKLAGKTVKVRFRVGADDGGGAPGWDIDDISFAGITNTPFSTLIDDVVPCADAGVVPIDGGAQADGANGNGTLDSGGAAGGSGVPDAHASDSSGNARDGSAASDDGGCSCSFAENARRTTSASLFALLGALAMVMRRRRSVD